AREEVEKPMDLPTWMASHSDAVLAAKSSFAVQQTYSGPRETREYDIAKVLAEVGKEAGATSEVESRKVLESTLKRMYCRNESGKDSADSKGAAKSTSESSALTFKIEGNTLSATAPAALQTMLRRMLDAWGESGMAQIVVETRFLDSNRDLVSEL